MTVLCEQTRQEWRLPAAEIAGGLIFVEIPGFEHVPASTYTITAKDGGERTRRFISVTVDWPRSTGMRVAFR
ncbi:MAG TPA: hypothetical protein VF618_15450 [Thermoanaerobaculia bacterium]